MARLTILRLMLSAAAAAASVVPALGDGVDDVVAREMRTQHIPGMSVAVSERGRIVKAQGYGLANVELGAAATQDTVYEIASLTKPITAAAVLLLVEEGRVGLDDPLAKHVAGLPEAWGRVTVRQALNHTGGIPRDPFPIGPATERLEYSRRDILRLVSPMPLRCEPGRRFEYSNLGYYLLGAVIEEASGMSYADWLQRRIFQPTRMASTRVNDDTAVIPGRARGHEWRGELRLASYQSPSSHAPAGGVLSTVVDLAKWDAAVSDGSLLRASSREQMWRRAQLAGGGTCSYGMGWNLDHVRGRRDVNHRGSNGGFSSTLHRYEDEGLTVIVLANLAGADLERVARGVAGCFVPELAPLVAMSERPDPHPEWAVRLREGLTELCRGRRHPAFSPEFADEFARQGRAAALAARLEHAERFSFLGSHAVGKWRGNRPGGAVDRLEFYRLLSGSRSQGYAFEVDRAGRVVWLEVEEDPPLASAMPAAPDDAPELTKEHARLAADWAAGAATTSGMSAGLKDAFTAAVLDSYRQKLANVTGLRFIASRDVRGDGAERLGSEVARCRYYAVERPGPTLYMEVYLRPDGKIADVDLAWN